jgi:hypothetical protein
MAYPAKIDLALQILAKTKIRRFNYAPPVHRLLWSFGIPVRPPYFAGFWSNFLQGTAWALVIYPLGLWLLAKVSIMALLFQTPCAALLCGLISAVWFERAARRAKLPDWSELDDVAARFD